MGLINGVRNKLGFGGQPEWQDDECPYDEEGYYGEDEGAYDDDLPLDDDDYYEEDDCQPTGFDAYDPGKFSNITINPRKSVQVASYDDIDDSYSSRARSSQRGSNVRSFSDYSSHSGSGDAAGGWGVPSEPSFLDDTLAANPRSRDSFSGFTATSAAGTPAPTGSSTRSSGDFFAQFDRDISAMGHDVASRVEIVLPHSYSDNQKIGTAFRAGKIVAVVCKGLSDELARRVLDFSYGVAFALDGKVEKGNEGTYIMCKSSHRITSEERDYLRQNGAL